ncbi:hypothetical protein LPB140_03710 [Sphingorhabdus lutea]|uniref:Uncharacterized protein n=1 Tax=Sphingorhabdus lutea TaxID=1913578 RepID=A0A1L3JAA4_9SPHN|nr:hypothetical protein [Sphingorhabdus lutea]APG62066.1 hypothetical protein LPB140_03710 [Sphingorhabdus lutea]
MKAASITLLLWALVLDLFGCNKEPQDQLAVVKGQAYLIPWEDRPVVINEMHDKIGNTYVRISGKVIAGGIHIDLIVDPRWYEFQVANNYPSLFGYAGDDIKIKNKFVKIDTIIGPIICTKPYSEYTKYVGCGFRLLDEGVSWSINFTSKDIAHVGRIKSEAEKILKSYRNAANAKQR